MLESSASSPAYAPRGPDPDRCPTGSPAHTRRLESLNAYQEAWTACPDERAARHRLGICWTSDSWYLNPFCDPIRGTDALVRLVADYQYLFPGVRIRATRAPYIRRRHGHLSWALTSTIPIRVLGTDHGRRMTGHEVATFTTDHRLASVVVLLGELRA